MLIILSSVCALLYNTLSPEGIALVGEWDTSKGVVSAVAKNDPVVHGLEIDSVQTAKEIYDSGQAVFVDARSQEAFDGGHIRGAVSLPVYSFEDKIEQFYKAYPPSTYIITYCSGRECQDSHELAQLLIQIGYTHVRVYIDGFPVWQKNGFPVVKSSTEKGE